MVVALWRCSCGAAWLGFAGASGLTAGAAQLVFFLSLIGLLGSVVLESASKGIGYLSCPGATPGLVVMLYGSSGEIPHSLMM
ncbi:MAG: hypothetical protein M3453_09485, partial [Pseudomonadota bacterium]|nr:hypothetical protein [Pseudomonadota bacterium]